MPFDTDGRWYEDAEAESRYELASAARTVTGQTAAVKVEGEDNIRARLNITAASGTSPTLDAKLESSYDEGVTWETVAGNTWPQKTATGTDTNVFKTALATHVRWAWTIAGTTPSFTFAIDQANSERSR